MNCRRRIRDFRVDPWQRIAGRVAWEPGLGRSKVPLRRTSLCRPSRHKSGARTSVCFRGTAEVQGYVALGDSAAFDRYC